MRGPPALTLDRPVGAAADARPNAPPGEPEIVLDLSRLLSRLLRTTPTGIDRVELTYARALLRRAPERLAFAAVHPSGVYGRLPTQAVRAFLDTTVRRWDEGGWSRGETLAQTAWALWRLSPRPARPIEYPEFARPGGAARHRRRIETLAALADGLIAVSEVTRRAMASHLARPVPIIAAPLGAREAQTRARAAAAPYFVILGTIEPRKNHLVVLNALRQIVQALGPKAAPKLHVVGARGWESENVIDLLERSDALREVVIEHRALADGAVANLVCGARALLMPSFAEGYGMPVAEALSLGAPVVCSDIPAHREVGGAAPDYLDPTDGPAWRDALLTYAELNSARRLQQLGRIARWRAPDWANHMDLVLDFVARVAA
jgi:glycosyltransferase involved in cell wall biosynthesis